MTDRCRSDHSDQPTYRDYQSTIANGVHAYSPNIALSNNRKVQFPSDINREESSEILLHRHNDPVPL